MIVYSHEGGYGNVKVDEIGALIEKLTPVGSSDRVELREMLYDYECLLRVIEGQATFRHEDRSETRRLKLYGN